MKSLQWCQLFGFIIFTKHCYTTFIFYQVQGIIRQNSKRSKHSSVAGKANFQMKHSSREKRENFFFFFMFSVHIKSHILWQLGCLHLSTHSPLIILPFFPYFTVC